MLGKVNEKLMKLTVFKITIIIIAITCTLRIKKRFLPVYKVPLLVPKPTPTTYNKCFE